jgi:hypothetical protein
LKLLHALCWNSSGTRLAKRMTRAVSSVGSSPPKAMAASIWNGRPRYTSGSRELAA